MSNPYQSPEHVSDESPAAEGPSLPAQSFRGILWTQFALTVLSFGVGQSERIELFRPLFLLAFLSLASIYLFPLIVLILCLISDRRNRLLALVSTVVMSLASAFAILPLVQ